MDHTSWLTVQPCWQGNSLGKNLSSFSHLPPWWKTICILHFPFYILPTWCKTICIFVFSVLYFAYLLYIIWILHGSPVKGIHLKTKNWLHLLVCFSFWVWIWIKGWTLVLIAALKIQLGNAGFHMWTNQTTSYRKIDMSTF